jgi:cysteinyl-tRNA synthetase
MSRGLLGETFDIHGGGIDLQFPHHENEIAQSVCAHPEGGFARYWLHNEMLQVEGKKMSKSLGNFFTVRDLLDQGVPGEVIRFVMLGTHYRKPMDWTEKKRAEAEDQLGHWAVALDGIEPAPAPSSELIEALCNDLNTHGAITVIRQHFRDGKLAVVKADLGLLGFDLRADKGSAAAYRGLVAGEDLGALAKTLSELRALAKPTGDFSRVDRLKSALLAVGVEVRMSHDGVELAPGAGFDAAGLRAVMEEWDHA